MSGRRVITKQERCVQCNKNRAIAGLSKRAPDALAEKDHHTKDLSDASDPTDRSSELGTVQSPVG